MIVRRVAAVLALDVVGYTTHMTVDELATLQQLQNLRQKTLLPAFEKWQGRVFKEMGDGLLVEFVSVVEAVECAHFIQQISHADAARSSEGSLSLRIGIHFGEVIVENDDLLGETVNIAARIESICEPGDVWISSQARQVVGNRLELGFEPLGSRRLKNLAEPIDIYRVGFRVEQTENKNLPPVPTSGPHLLI